MVKITSRALGAAVVAGSLVALPAAASASPISAAATVALHTDRADDALARAAVQFEAGKERAALKSLNGSRAHMGKAAAAANAMVRKSRTPAQRFAAAKAVRQVAGERHDNVVELAKMLADAKTAAAETAIAKAALADVTGREKAIVVLQALLELSLIHI